MSQEAIDKINKELADLRALAEREKGNRDPLVKEQLEKMGLAIAENQRQIGALSGEKADLQKQVDDLQAKLQRRAGGGDEGGEKAAEQKQREAFLAFAKEKGLQGTAYVKAVSTDSDPAGGYGISTTVNRQIIEFERQNTPMRELCTVTTTQTEKYLRVVNMQGAAYGHVGEREDRGETTAPTLAELEPFWGEVYAEPATTQRALDQMDLLNLEQWLSQEVGFGFSVGQNGAFTSGNGVKKAKGILAYTLSTSADGTRAFGQIQKVGSGSSGNFVYDKLIELVATLKRGYRQGASFMTSTLGVVAIMQLKDGDSRYIFQPSYSEGMAAKILGYPVVENDDMPAPGAGANAAIFGNFKRGYEIVDLANSMQMLRDPFTSRGFVKFYTRRMYGGHVIDDRALKVYVLT